VGIIRTALTNKTLPLELEYRESSGESANHTEGALEMEVVVQGDDSQPSAEFACLLSAI
jgi:hypothetical protein